MRHKRLILLLLVTLTVTTAGQSPTWPTVKWQPIGGDFDSALLEGREVKASRFENVSVAVLMDDSGDYLAFLVSVTNKAPHRLIVNPASAFARVETPKSELLLTIPADKVAKAMEKRGRWKNALGLFFAGMAARTTSGTITDSSGNQSTVTLTEPNGAAQRSAQQTMRDRQSANRNSADIIREIGLRANTVFPNTDLIGWVFFEKKKFTSLTIGVFTGRAMYEFPFSKP